MQGNVSKRHNNSMQFSPGKKLSSAELKVERLTFAKLKVETLTAQPEIEFLTIGKKITDLVQVEVPNKKMVVTIWIEGDNSTLLSFDIASIPEGEEMQKAFDEITALFNRLVNQMPRWPDTLVIQTKGGDKIKQNILAFAVKLLEVNEKKDLEWKRYQTSDDRKAVLAFSVKNKKKQPAVEQNSAQGGPPPPPPPPPDMEISFNEVKSNKDQADKWKETYQNCIKKGKERYEMMMKGKRSLEKSDQDKRQSYFDNDYITFEVSNPDSPTGEALFTVWKKATSVDAGYKNTPLPEEGKILSWQNKKSNGERLTNSDIYFCQYQLARKKLQQGVEIPALKYPLKSLKRQQASADDTISVYNHLCFIKNTYKLSGTWGPENEEFYALLGTMNGSGPAFLVIDNGEELGIKSIQSIELQANRDTIYHFSNQ